MTESKEPYVTKAGHGGRRSGSGRKEMGPAKRRAVTFKLPPLLAERLKGEGNQTALIVRLLSEYYGVEPGEP